VTTERRCSRPSVSFRPECTFRQLVNAIMLM
jgi:hypothetical protein